MTSLIDVIFLLLLFFMLSSTFSRFSEVEISAASGGASAAPSDSRPTFLRLGEESLSLNGQDVSLDGLATAFDQYRPEDDTEAQTTVLVSLQDEVTSQRLTDLLVTLRTIERLRVSVLGASS